MALHGSADEDDLEGEDAAELKQGDDVQPEVSELVCEPLEVAVDAPVAVKIAGDTTGKEDGDHEDKVEDLSEANTSEHLSKAGVESGQVPTCTEERKQHKPHRGPKNHAEAKEIAALTKKLCQVKKTNVKLHTQLQRFYANEVVLQLENRLKEKQKRIVELMRENRTLKNSERILMKELEDIQNSKDDFPSKKRALQEELRVCKERIKQLKELHLAADEKSFKLHQQNFDLTVKNKGLSEKVKMLEGVFASSSLLSPAPSSICVGSAASIEGTSNKEVQTIIASQEEEITRLHQRVALMKKTHKAEHAKYERLLKSSQDEIEQTQLEMEEFYQQLFAKERAARLQFLHMKKLKHALHELALTQQTNQRFQPFLANRDMRLTNRSNGPRHNQGGSSPPQKGPVLNSGRWIHEALHHLGFVMPQTSSEDEATKSPIDNKQDDQTNIPSNCIQGKLVPLPPPSKAGFTVGTSSTRALPFNRSSSNGDGTRNQYNQYDVGNEANFYNEPATARDTAPHTPENPDGELGWEERAR